MERLYAAADVVALPARYEPFGNVHLEALASGVPVLSSAQAGGSEIVRNGDNGWVAVEPDRRPRSPSGLAALRDAPPGGWPGPRAPRSSGFTYAAQAQAFTALYGLLRR